MRMGALARQIRRECLGFDVKILTVEKDKELVDLESGRNTVKEELEWCIKELLKDESDSEELAAERMELVISPIIERIRI
jgi:hypothetical protein